MRKTLFILLLLISLPLSAADKETLFARIMPDREQVYAGDSMLVSVVLYSSAPIAKAECLTNLSVKGKCTLRKLDTIAMQRQDVLAMRDLFIILWCGINMFLLLKRRVTIQSQYKNLRQLYIRLFVCPTSLIK